MENIDLTKLRRSYDSPELSESGLLADPVEQLRRWIADSVAAGDPEPNAMCVASAHRGRPSARMVLLRGLDARGLVFFTSYSSRKGRELSENPFAACLFYWPRAHRQARIEGRVEQLPEDESDAYFCARPRGHQLGAWASEQSEPVESRELLDQRMRDYEERFEGQDVPRPHSWGGFLVRPDRFEFWQGRPNRMHDRLEFLQDSGRWRVRRLQP